MDTNWKLSLVLSAGILIVAPLMMLGVMDIPPIPTVAIIVLPVLLLVLIIVSLDKPARPAIGGRLGAVAGKVLTAVIVAASVSFVVLMAAALPTMTRHYRACQEYRELYPSYEFRYAGMCFVKFPAYGGGYFWRDAVAYDLFE